MTDVYDEAARDIVALASKYVVAGGKETLDFAEAMDHTILPDGWHKDYTDAFGILKDYADTPIGKLVTAINAELKAKAPKIGKAVDQNWVKPRYAAIKCYLGYRSALDVRTGIVQMKARHEAMYGVNAKKGKADKADKAAIAESALRALSRVLRRC